jgi:hypothetical protein
MARALKTMQNLRHPGSFAQFFGKPLKFRNAAPLKNCHYWAQLTRAQSRDVGIDIVKSGPVDIFQAHALKYRRKL